MTQESNESSKTSVYAIAAFISCLSFLMPILSLALPFIFAIMAFSEIKKSNGAIKGRGLAIAAIVIPVVAGILFIAMLAVVIPHHHHPAAMDIGCANNLKMIGLSMQMYAEDNGGFLPDSLDNSYIRESVGYDKTFVCPYCQKTGEKNTLLSDIGGKKLRDFDNPQKTPIIICRHHRKQEIILYADGHVQQIPKDGKSSQ